MKPAARTWATIVAALSMLTLGTFAYVRYHRAPVSAAPVSLELAQSVAPDFGVALESLLAPYLATHADVRVHVRYEPYPRPSLVAKDAHVALRRVAPDEGGAVPLFAADYVLLVYNKELVATAPVSWSELVGEARRAREQGKAELGLALPDEAYSMLPFFGGALAEPDGAASREAASREAASREAISLLFDLRYAYGLTPRMCPSECATRVFAEGRAPYLLIGEWRLPELRRALGDKLGVAALPPLPETGTKLRSVRRTCGLALASDTDGRERRAAEDLVAFLTKGSRDRLYEVLGKVPVPLEAPKDPRTPTARDEAALTALVADETVEAKEATVRAALEKIAPVLDELATGHLGPDAASRLLLAGN